MAENIHHIIFQPSACINREELRAYLEGKTSPGLRAKVENHLLDCPLCSDAVDGYAESTAGSLPFFADFSGTQESRQEKEFGKIRTLLPASIWSGIAAAAAVLLIGAFAYFNWFTSAGNDSLYNQYYTAYQNDIPLNLRSTEESSVLRPSLVKALESYAAGNFEQSRPLFETALKEEPNNDVARFFAGIACMETAEWEKAAEYLTFVRQNGGNYSEKATWYLALSNLKLNRPEAAKSLLQDLRTNSGFKTEETEQLLSNL